MGLKEKEKRADCKKPSEEIIEQERSMERKKDYGELLYFFDDRDGEDSLANFLDSEVGELYKEEKERIKALYKKSGEINPHDVWEIYFSMMRISFAAGYIFGQTFDFSDKVMIALVGGLRKKMIDGGYMKYYPRGSGKD